MKTMHSKLWQFFAAAFLPLWLGLVTPVLAESVAPIDYEAWRADAAAVEADLSEGDLSQDRLQEMRSEIATWRGHFVEGQAINAERIATLREQIATLGPQPAKDEASESPEITQRRAELEAQLAEVRAPSLAAEEAHSQADGLIREIDVKLRAAQTSQILRQSPSPLNPANWVTGWQALVSVAQQLKSELVEGWNTPVAKARFFQSLPLLLALGMVAIATTVFGRRWIGNFADWLRGGEEHNNSRHRLLSLIASLGQVIVPSIGFLALSRALITTGFWGPQSETILRGLPWIGTGILAVNWLANRVYPRADDVSNVLGHNSKQRAEGRYLTMILGMVLAVETLRRLLSASYEFDAAAGAVLGFPLIVVGAVALWRLAPILNVKLRDGENANARSFLAAVLALMANVMRASAVASVVLAAAGYSAAANSLLFPTITSLLLIAALLVAQRVLADFWLAFFVRQGPETTGAGAPNTDDPQGGLVPVLLAGALWLTAAPVFALLWGMRPETLQEIWNAFLTGFRLGDTTISPVDFAIFALIFSLGYMGTRLFQGALRGSVLPRTKIDQGGQNAIVSGAGYIGIFLSALIAIRTTGLDLSGLAIVASALSVGIGFGMQNIVQNFVSGIILMIERPVSEGDWIKVGQTEGIVKTISVRSTRIQTFDRNVVVVPNADLVSQSVTNWTRFGLAGRLIVPVSVTMDADSRHVERVLREIAEAQPMIILKPPPMVVLQNFAGSVYNFEIRAVLRDVNFATSVRSDINHMIAKRFVEEGFEMPISVSKVTVENSVPQAETAPDAAGKAQSGLT